MTSLGGGASPAAGICGTGGGPATLFIIGQSGALLVIAAWTRVTLGASDEEAVAPSTMVAATAMRTSLCSTRGPFP